MTPSCEWLSGVGPGAVWAFDVDGTLVGSIRSDVLRPGSAELLRTLASVGVTCVLWSAGGADYARRVATRHGIDGMLASYHSKDRRDDQARYLADHLEPRWPDVFVDDVPDDMPVGATVVAVPQFLGGNPTDAVLVTLRDTIIDHVGLAGADG